MVRQSGWRNRNIGGAVQIVAHLTRGGMRPVPGVATLLQVTRRTRGLRGAKVSSLTTCLLSREAHGNGRARLSQVIRRPAEEGLMKAIVCTRYGSPNALQLREVAKPTPRDGESLIRIRAASINARDWRLLRAKPFVVRLMPGGLLRPRNARPGSRLRRSGRNDRQSRHAVSFRR